MDEQHHGWPELGITDLADLVWEGRVMVVVVTALTLLLAAILYFVLPQRYQSIAEITPLTGASFSSFADLKEAGTFDYSRETLLAEYAKYLTDRDMLSAVERETNAPDVDVKFDLVLPRKGEAESSDKDEDYNVRMTARYDDRSALDAFVSEALKRASRNLAEGLRLEVERRIAAYDDKRTARIKRLEVEIAAKRQKLRAERADEIERLTADASIARAFGLDKPLELQAQALTIDRVGPAVSSQPQPLAVLELPQQPLLPQQRRELQRQQIFPPEATIPLPQVANGPKAPPSTLPGYFAGYLAIEEQLKQLRSRQSDDAYIPDLRDIEEQVYVLKNDPLSDHISQLLSHSALGDPETAVVASYSLAGAESKKSFPRLTIFAPVALVLGLILGACLAILRGVRKLKRNFYASAPGSSPDLSAS